MQTLWGVLSGSESGASVLERNHLGGDGPGCAVVGVYALRVPLFRAGGGDDSALHRERLHQNGDALPHPDNALSRRD